VSIVSGFIRTPSAISGIAPSLPYLRSRDQGPFDLFRGRTSGTGRDLAPSGTTDRPAETICHFDPSTAQPKIPSGARRFGLRNARSHRACFLCKTRVRRSTKDRPSSTSHRATLVFPLLRQSPSVSSGIRSPSTTHRHVVIVDRPRTPPRIGRSVPRLRCRVPRAPCRIRGTVYA